MKISYTKYGDYYLPDLTVPNKEYNIGRFGMMRLRYIKAHRSCFYTSLKLSGKLMDYIQESDNSAQQMYDDIISKFRKSIDSTCTDQMEWVRRMNFARHYAEELVLAEYVYPEGVERE